VAQVALCSKINTKHISTVWTERKILEYLIGWCKTWTLGFKSLMCNEQFCYIHNYSKNSTKYVANFPCTTLFRSLNLLKTNVYVLHQQIKYSRIFLSVHTVLMCFVFILEQRATYATYKIKWLEFITERKSVYSAVRTGSLNKADCASSLKG
jgi:hypothetical protein